MDVFYEPRNYAKFSRGNFYAFQMKGKGARPARDSFSAITRRSKGHRRPRAIIQCAEDPVRVPYYVVKLIRRGKSKKERTRRKLPRGKQREEEHARVCVQQRVVLHAWRHVCHERRDEISIYRDCLTTVASTACTSCNCAFRERLRFPPEFKFVPSCAYPPLSKSPASGLSSADLEI